MLQTKVHARRKVVKTLAEDGPHSDDFGHHLGHHKEVKKRPNWSNLSTRIQWVIDKSPMSANMLSAKCGVSSGYIGRLPKKLLNPKADVGNRLLEKLSAAGRTDFGWLSTGAGWPNEETRLDYEGGDVRHEERPAPAPVKSDILPRSPFAPPESAPAPAKRKRGR